MFSREMKCVMAVMTVLALPTDATALTAVKPLDGYACMNLIYPDEWFADHPNQPPEFAAPTEGSKQTGRASSIVFVAWPLNEVNGFVEIIQKNKQKAWIAANILRPWRARDGSDSKCIPSVMSNGLLGTTTVPASSTK